MATKQLGVITKWQDDKGFGFIKDEQGAEVFFHISDYKSADTLGIRPNVGDKVAFKLANGKNNRLKAIQVQVLDVALHQATHQKSSRQSVRARSKSQVQQRRFKSHQSSRLFIAIGFYIVLAFIAMMGSMGKLGWMVLGWYILCGIITFVVYAKDKAAAQNGKWRTPETTLHTLSMLGGWVGAMLAQTYLRHKSKKPDFRMVYYLTVIINLAGLVFLLAGGDI